MIPLSDRPEQPRRSAPSVVVGLIVVNVLVFLLEISQGPTIARLIQAWGVVPIEYYAGRDLPPYLPVPFYVTLITSQFLHGGLLHIGFNMLFLWIFGDNVEDAFGHLGFLAFYLLCGVIAALGQVVMSGPSSTPSIGASGAIAGVLAAYVILFPHAQVRTLILPIFLTRLSALVLIGFWIAVQIISGLISLGGDASGGIAYWAHVSGFAAGLLLTPLMQTLHPRPGT